VGTISVLSSIVYDRKSGNYYYANIYVSDNGFVTLKNPVKRMRESIIINKFKNGYSFTDTIFLGYGVSCNDFMLPGKDVVIEILKKDKILEWVTLIKDETLDWVTLTKEDAKIKLECLRDEANDTCKRDKQQYIDNLSEFKRFWYLLFNKK